MLHRNHCATLLSIFVTLAVGSDYALAQSSDESGDGRASADDGKKANASRGSGDRRSNSNERSDRRDSRPKEGPLAVPSRVNEAFTYPVGNGCQYSATVRGSIKSVRGRGDDEPRYSPNLTVNAWVTCQNNTELRVTDTSIKETSMTRSALEQAIEMRAGLLSDGAGKRCVYLPDFSLGEGRLAGTGVSYMCTSSTSGGLADNQDSSGTDDGDYGSLENRPATDGKGHDNSRSNRNDGHKGERGESRDNGRDRKGPFDDGQ